SLCYWYLIRSGFGVLTGGIVVILLALMIQPAVESVRPQLATYLFFLVTLVVIKKADAKQYKWLLLLPPVFALWANMHGGFLSGPAILGVWSCVHLLANCRRGTTEEKVRTCAIVVGAFVASLLFTFANPYGIELLQFLLRTATVPRSEIVEW